MKKPKKPVFSPPADRQQVGRYSELFPEVLTPQGPLKANFSVLLFVGGYESPCLLAGKHRFVHLN